MNTENAGTIFKDSFSEEIWRTTYKNYKDESVNDTFRRVAKHIASAEETEEKKQYWESEFYNLLSDFKGVSGGRITANAGTEWEGVTFANCVAGETMVHTINGIVRADSLEGKAVKTLSKDGVYRDATWKSYGKQKLYKVVFSNGEIVYATKDHKWVVSDPKKGYSFEIKDRLSTVDIQGRNVPVQAYVVPNYDEDAFEAGYLNGLVYGDGWEDYSRKYASVAQFMGNTHLLKDLTNHDVKLSKYKGIEDACAKIHNLPGYYKQLPMGAKDISYLRGFVAGMIATDGSIDSRGHVMLFQADLDAINNLQFLFARAGVPSSSVALYREKSPWDDTIKPLYCIRLFKSTFWNDLKLVKKQKHIDYLTKSPSPKFKSYLTVVSVEETDREEVVYCCEEPETHTMVIGSGILTGQCYVGGIPDSNLDSLEGIYKVLVEQAKTLKSEGGWGMDFSWIRPRGSFIAGIGVESPGAVRFMELFDKSSEIVTSGSGKKNNNKKSKEKIRKGAQMGVMSVWHPDIIEFITAKQTPGRLSKFNISVNCTEDFMQKVTAVESGDASQDEWNLVFPDTAFEKYKAEWNGDLNAWKNKGYPVVVHNTVKVSWLWNLIMESTYNRNEPGVLFLDRANDYNALNYSETIIATNP